MSDIFLLFCVLSLKARSSFKARKIHEMFTFWDFEDPKFHDVIKCLSTKYETRFTEYFGK